MCDGVLCVCYWFLFGWLRGYLGGFCDGGRVVYGICIGYELVVVWCFWLFCAIVFVHNCPWLRCWGRGGKLCVWGIFVDCGAFLGFLLWCVMGLWFYGLWIYMRENVGICINICIYMHDFIIFAVGS